MRCLDLDRVTPTRRPDLAPAGTQRWRELLFVHWALPLEAVRPLVPAGLDLDAWDGKAWVGLVPFRMEAIRSAWMPRRAGLDFLETNLRTYVHKDGEPGVWFFSLEASSWLAVRVARLAWSLPYWLAEMSSTREGEAFRYASRRSEGERVGAGVSAEWTVGEALGPSAPGSLEFFLLERYLLFSERRGRLRTGQVHHAPYPARRATLNALTQSLTTAAGLELGDRAPDAVHYSDGVEVEVFGPWDLDEPDGRVTAP